jgi:UDP-N-acetyl-D-glucosamine dehydrogenase
MATEFIELAGKVNQQMPYHCVAKAQRALNDRGMSVKGARIAVVGVSYKPGVGDVRESPALKIISLLRGLGAEVLYHDPHVPSLHEFALTSTPLEDAVVGVDLALIVTAHPSVDHELIARRARLVLDLRGVTRKSSAASTAGAAGSARAANTAGAGTTGAASAVSTASPANVVRL